MTRLLQCDSKQALTALRLLASGELDRFRHKLWVRWHGLDFDYVDRDVLGITSETGCYHSATPASELRKLLKALRITGDDSIVDLGCGKGAALIECARHPFRRIMGYDIAPAVVGIANQNLKKLNLSHIEVKCANATEVTDLDEFNYMYLFNPFPERVMQRVVDNLADSFIRVPRHFTLLYRNPTCHEMLVASGLVELIHQFNVGAHGFNVYHALRHA